MIIIKKTTEQKMKIELEWDFTDEKFYFLFILSLSIFVLPKHLSMYSLFLPNEAKVTNCETLLMLNKWREMAGPVEKINAWLRPCHLPELKIKTNKCSLENKTLLFIFSKYWVKMYLISFQIVTITCVSWGFVLGDVPKSIPKTCLTLIGGASPRRTKY